MELKTNVVTFDINFDNGDAEQIRFNPNDRDFINRLMNFEKSFDERKAKIDFEKYKERLSGESVQDINNLTPEQWQEMRSKMQAAMELDGEYEQALKDELNNVFAYNVSEKIFKYCEPLDNVIVGTGKKQKTMPYVLHFLEEFTKELEAYGAKINPAMKKYFGKYGNVIK